MFRKLTVILVAAALLLTLGGCSLVRRLADRVLRGTAAHTDVSMQPSNTFGPTARPTVLLRTAEPADELPASRQEISDAFRAIAFNSEYGSTADSIRKWAVPIRAAVHGAPTEEDLAALGRVMDGLNAIDGFPGISLTEGSPNMDIWFVPLQKMPDAVPGYVEGNWGFFSTSTRREGIASATVAIATDVTVQEERNHLIFEEVIQSTGLMQDSERYSGSIFYGQWTTVQQPTRLDWLLLTLLYNPEIKHGMREQEAMRIIEGLLQEGPVLGAASRFGWNAGKMAILQYTHAL